MADIKENERESSTKRKKRQRTTNAACTEKEDQVSRLQYEEDYADGFLNKLFKELDESLFSKILSSIVKIETNASNVKENYENLENMLRDRQDLQWALLGFLRPHQALECGKLMNYYEISMIKQFVRNLMSHFKRQPHLSRRVIDKLNDLVDSGNLRQNVIEEEVVPLLQKNSVLVQQLLKLLPSEKSPGWYYSSDDMWEDFNVDNDFEEEEIADVPLGNETTNTVPNNCIYGCKNNEQISLCPMCSVKFINGRIYIANGRILRPANLVFNPNEEVENTIRLTGRADFPMPSVARTRTHKRIDIHKESTDGNSSPPIIGTESEEELGEQDIQPRKRKRRNPKRLKIRFNVDQIDKEEKTKIDSDVGDNNHTDDTAASNDDASCDDISKDDNDNNFFRGVKILVSNPVGSSANSVNKVREVVNLEDVELNISSMTTHFL